MIQNTPLETAEQKERRLARMARTDQTFHKAMNELHELLASQDAYQSSAHRQSSYTHQVTSQDSVGYTPATMLPPVSGFPSASGPRTPVSRTGSAFGATAFSRTRHPLAVGAVGTSPTLGSPSVGHPTSSRVGTGATTPGGNGVNAARSTSFPPVLRRASSEESTTTDVLEISERRSQSADILSQQNLLLLVKEGEGSALPPSPAATGLGMLSRPLSAGSLRPSSSATLASTIASHSARNEAWEANHDRKQKEHSELMDEQRSREADRERRRVERERRTKQREEQRKVRTPATSDGLSPAHEPLAAPPLDMVNPRTAAREVAILLLNVESAEAEQRFVIEEAKELALAALQKRRPLSEEQQILWDARRRREMRLLEERLEAERQRNEEADRQCRWALVRGVVFDEEIAREEIVATENQFSQLLLGKLNSSTASGLFPLFTDERSMRLAIEKDRTASLHACALAALESEECAARADCVHLRDAELYDAISTRCANEGEMAAVCASERTARTTLTAVYRRQTLDLLADTTKVLTATLSREVWNVVTREADARYALERECLDRLNTARGSHTNSAATIKEYAAQVDTVRAQVRERFKAFILDLNEEELAARILLERDASRSWNDLSAEGEASAKLSKANEKARRALEVEKAIRLAELHNNTNPVTYVRCQGSETKPIKKKPPTKK